MLACESTKGRLLNNMFPKIENRKKLLPSLFIRLLHYIAY